jgi:putative oxidoreductase
MNALQNLAAPVGRTLLVLIMLTSGASKLANYAGTQAYMESMGVPGSLLPLVIALELLGGLAIIAGWQTRLAAFLLAGFCIVSGVVFHADFGDQMQTIMFMKNLSMAGGFLLLVALGPGAYALDNRGQS